MAEASTLERNVRAMFGAYRTRDADAFLALLHPDFSFTSPYDDALDRDAFMERCWPSTQSLIALDVKQVCTDGETAFVLYESQLTDGEAFRNVERVTFRDGLLYCVEVFFADPPAGYGRWKSDDIRAAATVRKLIEDRYQAIRAKDADAAMSPVTNDLVMFDVVDPLRHTNADDVRKREQEWFDGFDGPVRVVLKDLVVSADGDTAFAYSLNRYSGNFKAGGSTDMWVRHTSCYRLREQGWRLVHEHLSVPFDPETGMWSLEARPSESGSQQTSSKPKTSIQQVYGQLNCADLSVSEAWFEKLFDRPPDATPMAGLAEWHHRGAAGLQLFENSEHAGHGTLTLIVADLRAEHARLERVELNPSPIEAATTTRLVRMNDPDGNLVVLAQPRKV